MKKVGLWAVVGVLLLSLIACGTPSGVSGGASSSSSMAVSASSQEWGPVPVTLEDENAKKAYDYMELYFLKKDYQAAYNMLSDTAKQQFSFPEFEKQAQMIQSSFPGIESLSTENMEMEKSSAAISIFMDADSPAMIYRFVVVFGPDGGIWGVQTAKSAPKNQLALPDTVAEEEVTVDAKTGFPLEGRLTLPKEGKGPYPAVVLVHGSGPNDMDETIGGNQPFRDLAYQLPKDNIAVLRYTKRTNAYAADPQLVNNLTPEEETIEDAVAAIDLLKQDPRVDKDRIYIVGHSLGGMLTPRIAKESSGVAGMVSLAGTPRSLWDLIKDQMEERIALLKTQGGEETQIAQIQGMIDQGASAMELLPQMTKEEAKGVKIAILACTGYYMQVLDQYNPAQLVKESGLPALFLQGGEDHQVYPDKDYAAWQTELSGYDKAEFRLYPNLNHLFTPYVEDDYLSYYSTPGHVPEEVINDIAAFVNAAHQ